MFANSGEPAQTPRFAAPYYVLHCLLMFHKKDAMVEQKTGKKSLI